MAVTWPLHGRHRCARREGRLNGPVVIIADRDKGGMDVAVREEVAKMPGQLHVYTREGSPAELEHMDRAAAGTASRLIVVPPEGDEEDPQKLGRSTGLALALQRSAQPSAARRAAVVVAAPQGTSGDHVEERDGFGSYAEVAPAEFVRRLVAQVPMCNGHV